MEGDTRYSIGDLARWTRLSVRTIRFYSDSGVLPPADRSPAGYRRYGLEALARLDLIRTLRELDVDLATIRRVLDREVSIAEVAAVHAEALDVQIRTLRLRRAVLRAVAKRRSSPEEMRLMHKLAKRSDAERRRIIHQFIDDAFGDLDANPDFVAMMRSAMPELPDDPSPEQVDAWVELAELVQDRTSRRASAGWPNSRPPNVPPASPLARHRSDDCGSSADENVGRSARIHRPVACCEPSFDGGRPSAWWRHHAAWKTTDRSS
jgi:DNA-binding transcriptional MerR regulator